MQDEQTITMSSLLAGLFLASGSKEVEFSVVANMVNELFNKFGIDVEETDEDIDKLYLIVKFDDKKVILNYNFNDLIRFEDREIMIYDYLYNLTDNLIRNYFDIDKCMLKTFNNKKRTKVIAS